MWDVTSKACMCVTRSGSNCRSTPTTNYVSRVNYVLAHGVLDEIHWPMHHFSEATRLD